MVDCNPQYLTQHLQHIETEGFTILPNAIDPDLVNTIKAELGPYLRGQHPGRNDFEGLHSERGLESPGLTGVAEPRLPH